MLALARTVRAHLGRILGSEGEAERAAALATFVALVLFAWTIPFSLLLFSLGAPEIAAVLSACGVSVLAVPWLARRGSRPATLASVLVGIVLLTSLALASRTGGLASPTLQWLPVFPMVAVWVAGVRTGFAWLAALLGAGLLLGAGELGWWPVAHDLDPSGRAAVGLLSFPAAATVLMLVAWGYETTRVRMRAAVEASRDRAERALRSMRLLLDSVGQPLLALDRDGRLTPGHSAAAEALLGSLSGHRPAWEVLESKDPEAAKWLELGWPSLGDALASFEVAVMQLPPRLRIGRRQFALRYHPTEDRGVILELADITAEAEVASAHESHYELQALAVRAVRDPEGLEQLLVEGAELARIAVSAERGIAERMRALHTLKGNAQLFGLERLAAVCHEAESALLGADAKPAGLIAGWAQTEQRLRALIDRRPATEDVEVPRREVEALIADLDEGLPPAAFRARLSHLLHEPVRRRLERLAEQAQLLAGHLGKGSIDVVVHDGGVRLPAPRFRRLFGALAHAVKNAVDHGIESGSVRLEAGKPPRGQLRLAAFLLDGDRVVFEVEDDGAGVDFPRLRARAEALGRTRLDDEALLFEDGLSSRATVGPVSGRGVGMGSLREEVMALGGQIRVQASLGAGTRLSIEVPVEAAEAPAAGYLGAGA